MTGSRHHVCWSPGEESGWQLLSCFYFCCIHGFSYLLILFLFYHLFLRRNKKTFLLDLSFEWEVKSYWLLGYGACPKK